MFTLLAPVMELKSRNAVEGLGAEVLSCKEKNCTQEPQGQFSKTRLTT